MLWSNASEGLLGYRSSWVITCCCIVFLGETFWSHLLSPYGTCVYWEIVNNSQATLCCGEVGESRILCKRMLKNGAILHNEAERLPIINPNGRPVPPFDWLIHSGPILAGYHKILESNTMPFELNE